MDIFTFKLDVNGDVPLDMNDFCLCTKSAAVKSPRLVGSTPREASCSPSGKIASGLVC